jgi:hypothetical protein
MTRYVLFFGEAWKMGDLEILAQKNIISGICHAPLSAWNPEGAMKEIVEKKNLPKHYPITKAKVINEIQLHMNTPKICPREGDFTYALYNE